MLNEGLILMCTGMGTVFSFLVILWFAVSIMGKTVSYLNTIFPEKVQEAVKPVKTAGSSDIEVAVAIAAAKLRR